MSVNQTPNSKRSVVGEGIRRLLDEREEQRTSSASQTAMLEHRGRRHVVRLVNLSRSGAAIAFHGDLPEGDPVMLQLLDHGAVAGQVKWSSDGRVGINFAAPLDGPLDEM